MSKYACKFLHFAPFASNTGGATVAYIAEPLERGGFRIKAAFSYCNPNDNFRYDYGRAKSAGRLKQYLMGKGSTTVLDLDVVEDISPVDFLRREMDMLDYGPRHQRKDAA